MAGDEAIPAIAEALDEPGDLLTDAELASLDTFATAELRVRRERCERAEEAVSYTRRLLQGRLDLLRAELARREGDAAGRLLDHLSTILAGDERHSDSPAQTRVTRVRVPADADRYAAVLDRIVDETTLFASGELSIEELEAAVERVTAAERDLSARRRALFTRIDAVRAELAERYKDGRADVGELLN
jgi:chaperonin cofactor prefoldin